ncbi:MAG: hypothetical protein KatS3mg038_3752 [Candidatus Kapaibacterium sp.]|nr:MAG: hypothetical protein KatS3mg038_3752 [Candidatus Kapabacteria bacterium]
MRAVYTNRDYEPSAIARDAAIETLLRQRGIPLVTFKDQCIFEASEIHKPDGTPYTVYTPYSKAWRARLAPSDYAECRTDHLLDRLWKAEPVPIPSLEAIGFHPVPVAIPQLDTSEELLARYAAMRDYPADDCNITREHLPAFRQGSACVR